MYRATYALLLHLGEVEARGLHRSRACSSLYVYCIYELRFSEDEAFRRVAAARLVRRFPALFEAVTRGELHLTGLLMLGPHLTPENIGDVLARARHRTKKEVARLVRELAPLPDVPARIEPLGPAPARLVPNTPTWAQWAASLCPVRELAPGDRPGDWVSGANDAEVEAPDDGSGGASALPARASESEASESEASESEVSESEVLQASLAPALARVEATVLEAPALARVEATVLEAPALARVGATVPTAQRYRVEFTASEEYVNLVERAKALLSHALPGGALEELHLRAMRLLVAELEKRKYAVTARPAKRVPRETDTSPRPAIEASKGADFETEPGEPRGSDPGASKPRRRKRYVPASVRRAVFERDGGRCSYVDARGERCRETCWLELHHIEAFARDGAHSEANLTLRCAAHNALAAEADFGRDFVADKRDALRHESENRVALGLSDDVPSGTPPLTDEDIRSAIVEGALRGNV